VPFLRPLVAGLSKRRSGFDPTTVPVEYVVDKIFSDYSGFPCRYHSTSASQSSFILLPEVDKIFSDYSDFPCRYHSTSASQSSFILLPEVDKIFSDYSGFPCRYHSTSASQSSCILLPEVPYNHSDFKHLFLPLQKGCGPRCSKYNISGLVYVAIASLFKNNEM